MTDSADSTAGSPSEERGLTPAERLWALETNGDPDARQVARRYKTSPLNPTAPLMREVARATRRTTDMLAPTYARATEEDADEAEQAYAKLRAKREETSRAREEKLFEFAEAADRREVSMLRLTKASVAVALISLLIAGAALVVAIVAVD